MHPYYFEHSRAPVFPHQYPATQALLSVIFDAAAEAGVNVQFPTAPEVYDLLVRAQTKPAIDLGATYLQPPGLFRMLKRRIVKEPSVVSSAHRVAAAPLGPDRVLELVRQTATAVLKQRIADLGVRGSGAYEHYSSMLHDGFPVPDYELTALDIVRRQVPRLDAYHEIGAGIGVLSFLLALNGYPAVGIEHNMPRHETARAIWRALSAKADVEKAPCQLILGRFPAAVARCDTTQAIAILTNLVSTQAPEQVEAILAGLRRYRYVLIDLQRFCVMRSERNAQLELLNELRALGFEPLDPPAGVECAFVLLRNTSIMEAPQGSALWSRLMPSWLARR